MPHDLPPGPLPSTWEVVLNESVVPVATTLPRVLWY